MTRQPATRQSTTGQPTAARLSATIVLVGLLAALAAGLGISVPALSGEPGARAAVDEPQYLLSALSLTEDGDLDISDELAEARAMPYHPGALPVQTEPQPDGSQLSPHDPLLSVLLAPAVAVGGWVGAKVLLTAVGGLLAALLVWVAVRRFAVPSLLAAVVVAVATTSAPLSVYGQQVYPELPAALAVLAAVAALTGQLGRGGLTTLMLAVVALPWLSVKYAPVAAVLALLGLAALWRLGRPRTATVLAAGWGLAGVMFVWVHRLLYGGWTVYASGDHFQTSGELGVVGFAPDYAGRSTRLVGLLVDRDFGLVAWQPAWVLAVPALASLPWLLSRSRRPHDVVANAVGGWPVLVVPMVVGWLVATFVALTMHGYWFPGRQLVFVLPLAVLAVSVWLATLLRRSTGSSRWLLLGGSGLLGAAGVATYGWLLVAGWSGQLSWVGAPDQQAPAALSTMRAVLPDYRELDTTTWWLHVGWTVALLALAALGIRSARKTTRPPSTAVIAPRPTLQPTGQQR